MPTGLNKPLSQKLNVIDSFKNLYGKHLTKDLSCNVSLENKNYQDIDLYTYLNSPEFRKAFHVYEGLDYFYPLNGEIFETFKT